jgi:hypothetical protein
MKAFFFLTVTVFLFSSVFAVNSEAHVPYIEFNDYTLDRPYEVPRSVIQSIAVYSWLETDGEYSDDLDFYTFELKEPARVFVESLVPECPGYEYFLPWFAVAGPGLPDPEYPLPVELPEGYGAIIVENYEPGEERPTFYEFFGGKSYYEGPEFDMQFDVPGRYYIGFWDPYQMGGDYVAVIGYKEIWYPSDILRALILTPYIRADKELHVECD